MPLFVHCDGVEVYTHNELVVWSVSSALVGATNVFDGTFQVLKIAHGMIRQPAVKRKAFQVVAAFFAWCFEILQIGEGPRLGFYGEPFATSSHRFSLIGQRIMGPYSACFAGWKGDLKARKSEATN